MSICISCENGCIIYDIVVDMTDIRVFKKYSNELVSPPTDCRSFTIYICTHSIRILAEVTYFLPS